MEERGILESIVYAYLIAEYGETYDNARKIASSMTDEELNDFLS